MKLSKNFFIRATALLLFSSMIAAVILYQAGAYDISFIDRPVTYPLPEDTTETPNVTGPDVTTGEGEDDTTVTLPPINEDEVKDILASIKYMESAMSEGYKLSYSMFSSSSVLVRRDYDFYEGGLTLRTQSVKEKVLYTLASGLLSEKAVSRTEAIPRIRLYFGYAVVDNGKTFDIYNTDGEKLVEGFGGTLEYKKSIDGLPVLKESGKYYKLDPTEGLLEISAEELTSKAIAFDYPRYYGASSYEKEIYPYMAKIPVLVQVGTVTTKPPVTDPPVTDPPVTDPPRTEPPVTEPPVTEPPSDSSETEPPATTPPETEPPSTEPPVTDPPVSDTTTVPDETDPPISDTTVTVPEPDIPEETTTETSETEASPDVTATSDISVSGDNAEANADEGASDSSSTEPESTEPDTSASDTTEPESTEPDTSEPDTTPDTTPEATTEPDYSQYPEGTVIIKDGKLYRVEYRERYGYKNKAGKVVIEPTYLKAYDFTPDGIAAVVTTTGQMYFINRSGKAVVSLMSENIFYPADFNYKKHYQSYYPGLNNDISDLGMYYFDNGFVMIRYCIKDAKSATKLYRSFNRLHGTDGKQHAIPGNYTLENYSEGIMLLSKNGRYGYMDTSDAWVSLPVFDEARPFVQGLAAAHTESGYGMIDRKGNTVLPFIFDYISDVSDGRVAAYSEKTGWQIYTVMTK